MSESTNIQGLSKSFKKFQLFQSFSHYMFCAPLNIITQLAMAAVISSIQPHHCLSSIRGRMDDLSLFEYLSPFCFLSIEFHCAFSFLIKYYQILFIINLFWLGCDRPSGLLLFVPALLFPYSCLSSYLLCLFLYLISLLLFPCAGVWENTRA